MSQLARLAAHAALAGWTLGSPRRNRTDFSRLAGYDPIPSRMEPSHAIDAWIAWRKHINEDRPAEVLGQTALEYLELTMEESVYGYAALRYGFTSPASGQMMQPLPMGSEAIGRTLFWGLVYHGQPDKAYKAAYYDASIDHNSFGATLPAGLAATIAVTRPGMSISDWIKTLAKNLPDNAPFVKMIPHILSSVGQVERPRELKLNMPGEFKILDQHDINLNMAWILMGVVNGEGNPGKAMLLTAGLGSSAGHNTAAVGLIATLLAGGIEDEWLTPLGKDYVATPTLRRLDPPAAIEDFLSICEPLRPELNSLAPMEKPVVVEPVIEEVAPEEPAEVASPDTDTETAEESVSETPDAEPANEPVAEPEREPIPELQLEEPIKLVSAGLKRNLIGAGRKTSHMAGDLLVMIEYFDPPFLAQDQSISMQFQIKNRSEETRTFEFSLAGTPGLEVASRVKDCQLAADAEVSFPAVIKCLDAEANQLLRLRADGRDVIVPLAKAPTWNTIGPFANHDGAGYQKSYGPEREIALDSYHNGRSDMPVVWNQTPFSHVVMDVEPLFKNGPGVAYLHAKMTFPAAGQISMIGAIGTGMMVFVDGRQILRYHDVHTPVPRAQGKYMAEFETSGENDILVKVVRNAEPVAPLVLAFFDEVGRLVTPMPKNPE
ncbi:MAG: ADP-ribosylglycohydrolase family protein [Armatimonadetes bacterium]|nr:ADP-ribosylglycohydrolase family protein [Armatimonadota bacterium]